MNVFSKAVKKTPRDALAYNPLAEQIFILGDINRACEIYNTAIQLDDTLTDNLLLRE